MRIYWTALAQIRKLLTGGLLLSACTVITVHAEFPGYGMPPDIRPPFVLPQLKQADFLQACGQKPIYGSNTFAPMRHPQGRSGIFKRRMHRMHREMMQPPREPPSFLERWFGP